MRRFGVFLSISSIYAMTISSMAATLAPQGSILVNRGQGFQPVSAATEILPGDTILVNAGAKAAVTFGSVCSMQFPVAGSYSIPTETQCLVAQQNAANLANSSPSGLTSCIPSTKRFFMAFSSSSERQ